MFAALALVAALVGGVVAAAGLVLQLRRRRIRRQWQPTSGRTSGTRHSERGSGSSVSFTTDDGRDIEGAPLAYVDIGYYPVGKEVPVWYDPADPRRFHAHATALDRHLGVLLMVVGLVVVLVFGRLWWLTLQL